MVSKEKILKDIDEHLTNTYCVKVDLELCDDLPKKIKEEAVRDIRIKYSTLLDIRYNLRSVLIG